MNNEVVTDVPIAGKELARTLVFTSRNEFPAKTSTELKRGMGTRDGKQLAYVLRLPSRRDEATGRDIPYQVQRTTVYRYADGAEDVVLETVEGPVRHLVALDGTETLDDAPTAPQNLKARVLYRFDGAGNYVMRSMTEGAGVGEPGLPTAAMRMKLLPEALARDYVAAAEKMDPASTEVVVERDAQGRATLCRMTNRANGAVNEIAIVWAGDATDAPPARIVQTKGDPARNLVIDRLEVALESDTEP
ncbi:MAG: hypothetical protein SF028_12035 [Candidatus Sumerlaeia bacterium]|nr:hypothetical protein [Candidatus Sumerlaeia bacterium]